MTNKSSEFSDPPGPDLRVAARFFRATFAFLTFLFLERTNTMCETNDMTILFDRGLVGHFRPRLDKSIRTYVYRATLYSAPRKEKCFRIDIVRFCSQYRYISWIGEQDNSYGSFCLTIVNFITSKEFSIPG